MRTFLARGKPPRFLQLPKPLRSYLRLKIKPRFRVYKKTVFANVGDFILFLNCILFFFTCEAATDNSPGRRQIPFDVKLLSVGLKFYLWSLSFFTGFEVIYFGSYKAIKAARFAAKVAYLRWLILFFQLWMIWTGIIDLGDPDYRFFSYAVAYFSLEAFCSFGIHLVMQNVIGELDSALLAMKEYEEKKFIRVNVLVSSSIPSEEQPGMYP
ncbi:hypothetical protein CAEBREN_16423 [Caenorhabditis brenneri]|uniref:Uncharacterized protein n=1 Tax=Caenorhabditis brenneri TaxID=135651 RepID=G0PGU2_CAEBE|nr:hypothetical protein CAEBREN_16423 [Caenorhabditis brenneri]